MLIDYDILKHFGTTKARIKKVFTAQPGDDCYEHRKAWEDKLQSRIHEGAQYGLNNFQYYYAADLALETNVITKEMIPLSLFAQGKITLKDFQSKLKGISQETLDKFCTTKDDGTVEVDIPEFHKVTLALTRAFARRRLEALNSRYSKQFPFLGYTPYSTTQVAHLRADALSQRVEMITAAYGYRHDFVQCARGMLAHSFAVEVPDCAWHREKTLRKKKGATELTSGEDQIESVIAKEGIPFRKVHPTRFFYDRAYPLASLNKDVYGASVGYFGDWKLVPYRTVRDNPDYFNREKISYDTSFASTLVGYQTYWELYSADAPVNFPKQSDSISAITANDRDIKAGVYSTDGTEGDSSILFTQYFERVIPNQCGLGDYPHPVWVRLIVAADNTVVYGEFMPYTPAVYYGYNCDDAKELNMSFVHDAMAFQDQCSNILTGFLFAQTLSLAKFISMDISQMDPEMVKYMRKMFRGNQWVGRPQLLEHTGAQSAEMGLNRGKILEVSETQALQNPSQHIQTLIQLIGIAERLLGVSANEMGQSEPREVSATESANIAQVTSTSLDFMSQGIDEAFAAKKKILYQGLMSRGDNTVRVPIVGRYPASVIEAAGFREDEDGSPSVINPETPHTATVIGTKQALEYNYDFSSRGESNRPSHAKQAETAVLYLQQVLNIPEARAALGQAGLLDTLTSVNRMLGIDVDLKFTQPEQVPPTPAPATEPVPPAELPQALVPPGV